MSFGPSDDPSHRNDRPLRDDISHGNAIDHRSDLKSAQFRAESLRKLRDFFFLRKVLEVETPILSRGISLDCHIDIFSATYHTLGFDRLGNRAQNFYLQTSPEPHMKRLLTQGFPNVYQISKSFRNGELGKNHNPEFTMLEWYRRSFSLDELMQEVADVCHLVTGEKKVVTKTYAQVFEEHLKLNPFALDLESVKVNPVLTKMLPDSFEFGSRRECLEYLMSHLIEPNFDPTVLTFVHQFPSDQAAQAQIITDQPHLAYRFEVYGAGMELGNGYLELIDAREYESRFDEENVKRRVAGKPTLPKDQNLLDALHSGLPACAGVAVGFDRLLMVGLGHTEIQSVLNFPWSNC